MSEISIVLPGHVLAQFGSWLRKERRKRAFSRRELGQISELPWKEIANMEYGAWEPKLKPFLAVAEALNLSPLYIYRKTSLLPEVFEGKASFEDRQLLLSLLNYEEQYELRDLTNIR
jgi:transcriptional regulator with XRE-family HTH domain